MLWPILPKNPAKLHVASVPMPHDNGVSDGTAKGPMMDVKLTSISATQIMKMMRR